MQTSDNKRFWVAGSFLFAVLLIVSRRPDAVTRAQFYAEDGLVWYAQAYALGPWHALLQPRDGYWQTLPRLAAALALLFPLAKAPLVMNVAGLLVQALPVPILVSSRLQTWIGFPQRLLMAATYLALPNAAELHVSVTEAHWHLALAAGLIVLASLPSNRWQTTADGSILLLCGLSGPFVIPLAAIAWCCWWFRRKHWRWTIAIALTCCAMLQGLTLLFSHSRPRGSLGPSFEVLTRMLAAQVYEGALIGRNAMHRSNEAVVLLIVLLGSLVVAYCLVEGKLEWKLLVTFCAIVFAGSLLSPNAGKGPSQWATMTGSWDNRYWFFGMLAFVWSLVWMTARVRSQWSRAGAGLLLAVMLAYTPKNWVLKPADNVHFAEAARRFEKASQGETVTIPVLPAGWSVDLRKR